MKEPYDCLNCVVIRINWCPTIKEYEYMEYHGFCWQREAEVIIKKEKK